MTRNTETFVEEVLAGLPGWFEDEERFKLARMDRKYYPYTEMFSPIRINGITVKNRIVMGPMGNISMAEEMGRPANKMVEYFTARARGGVGLITSGLIPISQGVDPSVTEVGDKSYFPRIDGSRTVFSGWRDLAENVHAYGSHFFIQLTPGLGRVGSPECLLTKFKLPVSASWNPNFYLPDVPCRPLTDGQLRKIIKNGAQAAANAKAANIDGVYLHGHEGYLLEQLTNPAFNRRLIGRYSNFMNFGLDLVKAIRKAVGPKYPIMYRIDLSLALNATYGERINTVKSLRKFKDERTVSETLEYMEALVKEGVDLFDVDFGSYDNWWLPHPPTSMPSGCFLEVSRLVKEFFKERGVMSNAGLPVPIVAVGKLGYPDLAEKALRDGDCDMIMLARPLLADPEWANKAFAGKVEDIRPCIGDQEGCINEFVNGGHPQCAVNPLTGFEDVISAQLPPANPVKKIAVVGAGPAGVMAAVVAARRGHQVTLFEKRSRIGGMLIPGSVPKIKYEVANYLTYLEKQVAGCVEKYGMQLKLDTSVDAAALKEGGFDAVLVCAGAAPVVPPLPGVNNSNVVQAVDLLRDPSLAQNAEKVVIIGGGAVGCECAHWLAVEHGKQVTLVEMLPYLMNGVCTANRGHLIHEMEREGVQIFNCTSLKSIQDHQVTIRRNMSPTVPTPLNTWAPILPDNIANPLAKPIKEAFEDQNLDADLVVMAIGLKPDTDLYQSCVRENAAPEVRELGDAFKVGRVFEAVKSGFAVGRTI